VNKTCIQNFNAFIPKIYSIDSDDFLIEINLIISNECKLFLNKFSIIWDKENPFYENSNFSNDFKILTIKNKFMKEGEYNFSTKLFYEYNQIDNLILNSKFRIDKVKLMNKISKKKLINFFPYLNLMIFKYP